MASAVGDAACEAPVESASAPSPPPPPASLPLVSETSVSPPLEVEMMSGDPSQDQGASTFLCDGVEWEELRSDDGTPYYFNCGTGETQWERPVPGASFSSPSQ